MPTYYSGGTNDARGIPIWVARDIEYAKGYARKSGGKVWAVDVPDSFVLQASGGDPAARETFQVPPAIADTRRVVIPDIRRHDQTEELSSAARQLGQEVGPAGSVAAAAAPAANKVAQDIRPNQLLDDIFDPQPAAPPGQPPAGPAPPASAAGQPPPVPRAPAPGQTEQNITALTARDPGAVSAFDRPVPVIVMGPKPLPVKMEGGGDGAAPGGQPAPEKSAWAEIKEALAYLFGVLGSPSAGHSQSGPNLARFAANAGRIGGNVVRAGRKIGGAARKLFGGKPKAGRGAAASRASTAAATAGRGAAAGGGELAAGAELAAAAGPVGVAVAGVVALGAAAVEAGKQVYNFARQQEAEIRRLSEFGGAQAAGVAQLDAARTLRDVKTAKETGGSSADLTSSLDKFETALQPIEAFLTNVANTIGARLLDDFTNLLGLVKPVVELLNKIYNALPGSTKDENIDIDLIDQITKQQEKANPAWPVPAPQVTGRWGGR